MRQAEIDIFKKLLVHIGKNHEVIAPEPLTGFLAMQGNLFSKELMIVGRAVNGWEKGWNPSDLVDDQVSAKVATKTFGSITHSTRCPMQWVSNSWERKTGYNTKRSAFWRVTREVVGELGIADPNSAEWPSHLVWTNLYKVSPEEGGNPSTILSELQLESCRRLLQTEVKTFAPVRMLFLTGYDWASPFLKGWVTHLSKSTQCQYVEAIGTLESEEGDLCSVVVASHPQGKNEAIWVQEVVTAFRTT